MVMRVLTTRLRWGVLYFFGRMGGTPFVFSLTNRRKQAGEADLFLKISEKSFDVRRHKKYGGVSRIWRVWGGNPNKIPQGTK